MLSTASSYRVQNIDIVKGIAIILMVFCHTRSGIDLFQTWVYAWHMPIFFFICGWLTAHNGGIKNIRDHLKKRLHQLAFPYFIWCSILLVFYAILSHIGTGNSLDSIYRNTIKILSFQGIDSLWFIPIYAVTELLVKIIFVKINNYAIIFINAILIALLSLYAFTDLIITRILLKVACGVIYASIGYIAHNIHINRTTSYLLLFLSSFCALCNGFSAIGNLTFGRCTIISILSGATMCFSLLHLFNSGIQNNHIRTFISTIGRYSIIILCTNNILIEIIHLIDYKIFNNILLQSGIIGQLITTTIIIVINFFVINLSSVNGSFIFGIKKTKQSTVLPQ